MSRVCIYVERREPDGVGWQACGVRSEPVSVHALLQGEREPPSRRGVRGRTPASSGRLSRKAEHRLELEHDLERARRERWHVRDLEAAGEAAGALRRNGDGAAGWSSTPA